MPITTAEKDLKAILGIKTEVGLTMKKGLSETCYRFFVNVANPATLAMLRATDEKTNERKRTRYCNWTRTKHDFT